MAKDIANTMIKRLDKEMPRPAKTSDKDYNASWTDIIDLKVYTAGQGGMRMLYAFKVEDCICKNGPPKPPPKRSKKDNEDGFVGCSVCMNVKKVIMDRWYEPVMILDALGQREPDEDVAWIIGDKRIAIKAACLRTSLEAVSEHFQLTPDCPFNPERLSKPEQKKFKVNIKPSPNAKTGVAIDKGEEYDPKGREASLIKEVIRFYDPENWGKLEIRLLRKNAKFYIVNVAGEGINYCQKKGGHHEKSPIHFRIYPYSIIQQCYADRCDKDTSKSWVRIPMTEKLRKVFFFSEIQNGKLAIQDTPTLKQRQIVQRKFIPVDKPPEESEEEDDSETESEEEEEDEADVSDEDSQKGGGSISDVDNFHSEYERRERLVNQNKLPETTNEGPVSLGDAFKNNRNNKMIESMVKIESMKLWPSQTFKTNLEEAENEDRGEELPIVEDKKRKRLPKKNMLEEHVELT
jgi:hypothetical protein